MPESTDDRQTVAPAHPGSRLVRLPRWKKVGPLVLVNLVLFAVTGVIGGYEQGGDTPSVSYSIRFGQTVRNLYNEAVSKN